MKRYIFAIFLLASIILAGAAIAGDDSKDPATGEEINWQVISSGAENNGTSASYGLAGTVGQTAGGSGSSASFGLNHGFLQDFGGGGPDYVCGDADGNTIVEISDAVFLISYVFVPGSPAPDPLAAGDADCNIIVEITDAVYLIGYVFVPGSPAPCDPDDDGEPDC